MCFKIIVCKTRGSTKNDKFKKEKLISLVDI